MKCGFMAKWEEGAQDHPKGHFDNLNRVDRMTSPTKCAWQCQVSCNAERRDSRSETSRVNI